MLRQQDVKVIKQKVLNGTIDGHNPLLCTFRIKGPQGWFRLTIVTANLGRGYSPAEFIANVEAIIGRTKDREYVVILWQEIDEADLSPEHRIIRDLLPKGCTLVEWWTREPIAAWPGIKVKSERRMMTMDQGSAIGAPKGTGPRRFLVSCVAEFEGLVFWFGNQHPHKRNDRSKAVAVARNKGEAVTQSEVRRGVRLSDLAIYGGDMNDMHYPKSHPLERTAMERGLDTIRYVVA